MAEEEALEKDEFESYTYSAEMKTLNKGDYVIFKEHLCKVIDIALIKRGKWGNPRAYITVMNISTRKKYQDICNSKSKIEIVIAPKKEYQLADIGSDGFVTLILEDGTTKEDLKFYDSEENQQLKDKLQEELSNGKDIILETIVVMGEEYIVDYREIR